MTFSRLLPALAIVSLWTGGELVLSAQSSGVLREVYSNIGGTSVSDLTTDPTFPNSPSSVEVLTQFEAPTDVAEYYGQRLTAYLLPPTSGSYTFWIASDDNSLLFLSTDDTPANKRQIASVPGWTNSRQWEKYAEQTSAAVPLVSGKRYYIEALMKEGGGGDNLAVRWQLPSGAIEEPIPNNRLVVYGLGPPEITQQPLSQTVTEGGTATFTVQLARAFGASYQWKRGATDILGATSSAYVLSPAAMSDNSATFRCGITNSQGGLISSAATLTVLGDTTPPTVLSVGNLGDNTVVTVLFSEPLESSSGANRLNYTINNGVTVNTATLSADYRSVALTTSALGQGLTYTLTVNNVRDRAAAPNTIAPNTQRTFSIDFTPLDVAALAPNREPIGPSTRRSGLTISEIMYHPTNRVDGKELEFIELYNSQVYAEDLSGFRLTGDISYTFSANTTIAAGAYLVVAPVPADVQSAYGIVGVLGGFTNRLSNGSGTIRLRNRLGAIMVEANFSGDPPWPVAADGAGHSLVLARPTFGEGNREAWEASDRVGGSPGMAESAAANPHRTILINEFLAHTDDPEVDFIELYNYSASAVNLTGCILTDDPTTNRFVIPGGSIPARGFAVFTQTALGFSLNAAGETIYLKNPAGTMVIDAVHFEGQQNGVSTGRYPDGAPAFSRLIAKTPGSSNGRAQVSNIILNEIMYRPLSGNDDDEFIELYNRGPSAVNLGGWQLNDAVSFVFPTTAVIPAGGYVVVANNAARLLTNYTGLKANTTFGDYGGKLGNGERLALTMPDEVISTNGSVRLTNIIHITLDEVTFGRGGRWGKWADEGGSSLELVDSRSDHRLAPNWADSDESNKSGWTNIEYTGVLDLGQGSADSLNIILQGAGECLVDNVEVFASGSGNLIANSDFESGFDRWFVQGTHDYSFWQSSGGYGGGKCLHIVASGRGDTGANRVRAALTSNLSAGQTATLRAKVRWLKGNPEILLRLHGNWLEAYGNIAGARNLGTPGAVNSRALANIGPAIHDVTHSPVLPTAGQAVVVRAQVGDPDGLAALVLKYRVDPATNFSTVSMVYNGAGIYSASIPGQGAGAMVAFHLQAADNASPGATTFFPNDAPVRECLVRFGEPAPSTGRVGTYHLWITQATNNRWTAREKNSNEPLDATFVYGSTRVVYNVGTLYSGSPWHTPGFNGPLNNICDYIVVFPEDDLMLGTTDFVLATLGNGYDDTAQREQAAFWMVGEMGAPTLYRRPVNMFINGLQRGVVYEDSQQPSGDVIDQWFSDDPDGELHKIEDWFEFTDSGDSQLFNVDATLQNFTTTGGAKKLARYRWNWRKRAVKFSANDYAEFFRLVDAVNAARPEPFNSLVGRLVDYEEWARVMAIEHIVGNWDSYGYNRGKNMYTYKPKNGKWTLIPWDIDFVLDNGGDGPATELRPGSMPINDSVMRTFLSFPPIQRAWWRALQDAVNGPLLDSRASAMMNAKYSGLIAAGISVASPDGPLSYISSRRNYIQGLLAEVASPFAITSNGGANFSTNRNYISISGTAPVTATHIAINGVIFPVTWTSVANWTATIALNAGANVLAIAGLDSAGNIVAGGTDTVTITYTGTSSLPQDHVIINEIMYNPAAPNAAFVELYNTSSTFAFDLSGYRLSGADFTFPGGTIIAPNGFQVIANNLAGFMTAFGNSIPLAGVFEGKLKNSGETLKLVRPGIPPAADLIVDEVSYDSLPPWPARANGFGPSLQLIDPALDNNRVANWGVAAANPLATPGAVNSIRANLSAFPLVWLNEVQPNNATGLRDNFNERDAWVEIYNGGASTADLAGFYLSDTYSNLVKWPFPAGTTINPGAFRLVWLDNQPAQTSGTNLHANFRAASANGSLVLTRVSGAITSIVDYLNFGPINNDRSYGAFPDGTPAKRHTLYYATPNGPNSNSWPAVPVFVNEWMASNTRTIADPADGKFSDWFELYNAGPDTVDLSGYTLGTTVTGPPQFTIPPGYTIPSGGFLLVWADDDTGDNSVANPALHVGFRLAASGEAIALFTPTGTLLESVTFGQQANDISQGRWPDGNSGQYYLMTNATPGRANVLVMAANNPPSLAAIANQTVFQGSTLTFTAAASDPDAGQTLSFSLDAGAPQTAFINSSSGIFTWTPGQADPPAVYPVSVRVTDNGSPPLSDSQLVNITVLSPPPLVFTAVELSQLGVLTLKWATQPQKKYRLSFKTDLGQSTWTPLVDLTATGAELSALDNVSTGTSRLYRVEVLP